jgi:hypothetical protein
MERLLPVTGDPGNDHPEDLGPCPHPYGLCLDREGAAAAGHNHTLLLDYARRAYQLCGPQLGQPEPAHPP